MLSTPPGMLVICGSYYIVMPHVSVSSVQYLSYILARCWIDYMQPAGCNDPRISGMNLDRRLGRLRDCKANMAFFRTPSRRHGKYVTRSCVQ